MLLVCSVFNGYMDLNISYSNNYFKKNFKKKIIIYENIHKYKHFLCAIIH